MRKLLITGAAGRIGRVLRDGLAAEDRKLRLTDLADLGQARLREEVMQADLADLDAVRSLCNGMDAVIHLAGVVSATMTWPQALQNCIIPNYNVFEAAREQGVRRVIFASSIHAHGFVRRSRPIGPNTLYRPDSLYGLAKVFGEATGRLYADKHGLEVVCLRIASFRPQPASTRELGTWISPRDMVQLVQRSLEATEVHFITLHGVSKNDRGLYDERPARELGYCPEDDSGAFTAAVAGSSQAEPELEQLFHGAHFITPGFSGDVDRID